MLRLFHRLYVWVHDREDVGLLKHQAQMRSTLTQPGRYDFDKAVAGKKRSVKRQERLQKAHASRNTSKTERLRLRAIK